MGKHNEDLGSSALNKKEQLLLRFNKVLFLINSKILATGSNYREFMPFAKLL